MQEYILKTSDLSVGYDGKTLIHDINISVKRGQVLTLIGPNGSGKSTILKTLTKYLKSIAGTVYVGENQLDHISNRDLAKQVSVVLTQRLRTEMMTCEDVVATGRYPHTGRLGILTDEDRQVVRETMEKVNILELKDRDYRRISDGQRQRVLLARAICQQPQIIVLDEPTSYLDVRYKLELLGTMRKLAQEKNIAVVMSLHELDMAERVSDYVMCVKGDTIAHYGSAEEIFKSDLVTELYDLKGGTYNPLFGCLEMGRVEGDPKVFVLCGGGSGVHTFRSLQKKMTPFAAGILSENDVDYQVAKDLAVKVISVPTYTEVSEGALQEAIECLKGCDSLMVCTEEFGHGNRRCAELITFAEKLGKEIIKK
ncbi:MAG: ABC transporter ATP-binding protein [Firmicutes bacterium]|nr:ABC transporter ATP-binding protein [Bacillota bacterium]